MPRDFTSEEWRAILRLAREASTVEKAERARFLLSKTSDEDAIAEALTLADQFDLQPDEPLGRSHTMIGRFELREYLGSGGSGEVYTANDPELGRQVAVKIFRSDVTGSQSTQQRFLREARAASALNHPNIVTIHEIIRSDTKVAIVMELVPGSPLRTLRQTELPPQTILAIGQQVAEALGAAHSVGIIHRDIKPENIMLLPDGRIKILDFGLARRIDNTEEQTVHTVQGGIPGGTLRYMSPEHFRTQTITAKSDVFALGLVLCELVSGKHPFAREADNNSFSISHAMATDDLPRDALPDSGWPPLFESIVRAMLAKDPEERPTAELVATTLRSCALQLIPTPQHLAITKSRWKSWLTVCIPILCLAIAAVIFFLERHDFAAFTTLTRLTQTVPENRVTAAAISPDGKFVSYANSDGIFIQSLKRGEPTLLNSPADFNVDTIAWLTDGTKIIVSGFSDEKTEPEVWSIPTNGGAARELRTGVHFAVASPDGSQIAFVNSDYSSVGTMDLDGQGSTFLLQLSLVDTIHTVLWASDGRHLVIQRRHLASGIEHLQESDQTGVVWSLDTVDLKRRQITASRINRPNRHLLSLGSMPGNTIAFVDFDRGGANTKGHDELFTVRMDPSTGHLSSVATPLSGHTLYGDHVSHSLSVSADGKTIAVLLQTLEESIFVANFNRAALSFSNFQRLTLTTSPSFPHAWTPDSRMVIFESDRTGSFDLLKQRIDGRLPESILSTAKRWEYLPQVTPDGRYILFASTPTGARPFTLMRVPIGGGVVEEVPTGGSLDEFRCSVLPQGQCVLRKTIDQSEFVYYQLDPVRGIGKELARTAWLPPLVGDWDISPDGNFIAIPVHNRRFGKVRVVPLSPANITEKQQEVLLPGLTQLACLAWLPDGSGWFVNTDTAIGGRMYFSNLEGRLAALGDIESCAVPSPDGTKVAFHHNVIDSNVWVMTGYQSSDN